MEVVAGEEEEGQEKKKKGCLGVGGSVGLRVFLLMGLPGPNPQPLHSQAVTLFSFPSSSSSFSYPFLLPTSTLSWVHTFFSKIVLPPKL